jgi:hypothetical protein
MKNRYSIIYTPMHWAGAEVGKSALKGRFRTHKEARDSIRYAGGIVCKKHKSGWRMLAH